MKTPTLRFTIVIQAAMVTLLLGAPRAAMAHAYPAMESPCAGSTIKSSPDEVTILYNAPIERTFAKLRVLDARGQSHNSGAPSLGADHRTLSVKVGHLAPGQYKVEWQVVADDGHRTSGSYTFTVAPDSR
jgi:methionine-rich copper-binding protein CopC